MNVSSLERSKRLYELSGWGDTYWWTEGGVSLTEDDIENGIYTDETQLVPRYDCGYLLRKLPKRIDVAFDLRDNGVSLRHYGGENTPNEMIHADTPEDALCLLAIKLFEEEEL